MMKVSSCMGGLHGAVCFGAHFRSARSSVEVNSLSNFSREACVAGVHSGVSLSSSMDFRIFGSAFCFLISVFMNLAVWILLLLAKLRLVGRSSCGGLPVNRMVVSMSMIIGR